MGQSLAALLALPHQVQTLYSVVVTLAKLLGMRGVGDGKGLELGQLVQG